eukprot:gene28273-34140_t
MGVAPTKEYGPDSASILSKPPPSVLSSSREVATFAGGCFWGIELAFQRVPGVVKTEVGYTQGFLANPTYEQVCSGRTGHTEAVQVTFDPTFLPYSDLLTVLFDIIDPTTVNGQGNDFGTQYRTGVYYHSPAQELAAKDMLKQLAAKYAPTPIATEVKEATEWYPAEAYHQQYLQKGGQCARTGDLSPIRCYG